jgi:RNA polymerase sigma factor (sigma-70 family)
MGMQKTRGETATELEALYRSRRGYLLDWAISATRSAIEAEDLIQSAFLGALANLDALGAVENLGAWLFASVRNRVIDLWRKRGRRERLGETEVSSDILAEIARATGFDPQEALVGDELSEALAEAIEALPEPQREVILAQALGGETFSAIAKRTGESMETIASRKRYAMKSLSRALREWMDD